MKDLINRESPQKLYLQLLEILKRKIESKEWDINFQIPTEEELCDTYGVSRATVRSALSELVKLGYLIRQQGKGTFVSRKFMSYAITMLTSFRELMLEPGVSFTTNVLAQTIMMPVDNLSTKLNVSEDKHIIYIKRATVVNNKPVILQEIYIPFQICPPLLEEDLEGNSLVELFKKYEIKITRVKNYFDITNLSIEEARLFDLPEGSPALLLNQHFFSAEIPVMFIRSIKRQDGVKLSFELERSQTEPFVYMMSSGFKET